MDEKLFDGVKKKEKKKSDRNYSLIGDLNHYNYEGIRNDQWGDKSAHHNCSCHLLFRSDDFTDKTCYATSNTFWTNTSNLQMITN